MSDVKRTERSELTGVNSVNSTESQVQAEELSVLGEVIGSAVLTATTISEQILALDDQAPRSWDLHKSGW